MKMSKIVNADIFLQIQISYIQHCTALLYSRNGCIPFVALETKHSIDARISRDVIVIYPQLNKQLNGCNLNEWKK